MIKIQNGSQIINKQIQKTNKQQILQQHTDQSNQANRLRNTYISFVLLMNTPYTGQNSNSLYTGQNNSLYTGQNNMNSNSMYTPQQSNRYINNNTYQQQQVHNNRVTQSIINQPSPKGQQQKAYLQRNQSFQNRQYNQQLIQLIAKIRSLQDDLLNQRFKNQSLQRKLIQQQRIIDNLQYELNRQSYQLQKYIHEIQLSNEKNIQILKYEQNLKIVGEEIQQLNDILSKRNNDYDIVCVENKQLVNEYNKLIEENNLMNVRVNMWIRDIQQLFQQHKQYMVERNIGKSFNGNNINANNNRHINTNNNTNNKSLNTPSPNKNKNNNNYSPNKNINNYSPNNNNNKYQSSFRQYPQNESLTFDMSNTTLQMSKRIQLIKSLCNTFSQQIQQINSKYQQEKKHVSDQIMRQKQRYIKLQYEHKLLQERVRDNEKKKDIISMHYNQQKYQDKLNQMLNKQDQYISTIQQLTQQNQQLKQQLSTMQQNHQFIQQMNSKQKQSIIKSISKQNQLLQQTITQLSTQLNQLKQTLAKTQQQYQILVSEKQQYTLEQNQLTMRLNKKIRKLQQQNYQHQIHIEQLNGEINLLNKQLTIIHQQQQQQ